MILFVANWASHHSLEGYMPISVPVWGRWWGKVWGFVWRPQRCLLLPWGLLESFSLTTPRGRTPSEDLALTLALDAASDKCWASSLESGRECLAAAWACFPSCGCQAKLYRGWQLCGDAIVWDLSVRGCGQKIIYMRKVVKNKCLPRPENYYVV